MKNENMIQVKTDGVYHAVINISNGPIKKFTTHVLMFSKSPTRGYSIMRYELYRVPAYMSRELMWELKDVKRVHSLEEIEFGSHKLAYTIIDDTNIDVSFHFNTDETLYPCTRYKGKIYDGWIMVDIFEYDLIDQIPGYAVNELAKNVEFNYYPFDL